jgi:hypothetical protein
MKKTFGTPKRVWEENIKMNHKNSVTFKEISVKIRTEIKIHKHNPMNENKFRSNKFVIFHLSN